MENRCKVEKIAFWAFVALTGLLTMLMAFGILSLWQKIVVMVAYVVIAVYTIFERAIKFVRNQSEIDAIMFEYETLKELHKRRYKALLSGKHEESDKLSIEFEELSEELAIYCHKFNKCPELDIDQHRELQTIENMIKRLRTDIYVP